jgi:thymidylate kinase
MDGRQIGQVLIAIFSYNHAHGHLQCELSHRVLEAFGGSEHGATISLFQPSTLMRDRAMTRTLHVSRVSSASPHPEFSVLLGPDYAGKSTVLSALAARGVQCVSYDQELVRPDCSLVNELRDRFVTRALRSLGTSYSADFVVTLLQTAVVYLRDEVMCADRERPVVVDSYYYKILAKCVLSGLGNESLFAWWRSFPRPRQVIYLDVDPATAWRRSGEGSRLNSFEFYGDAPTWEGFRRFQIDLRRLMAEEIGAVPMDVLSESHGDSRVIDVMRRITRRDDAFGTGR